MFENIPLLRTVARIEARPIAKEERRIGREEHIAEPAVESGAPPPLALETPSQKKVASRVILLFALVVLGILAHWFWGIGWEYLKDPGKGLHTGGWTVFWVRLGLSAIVAALTFAATYKKIDQSTSESWVPFLLAFQNGFFWESAFGTLVKSFQASGTIAASGTAESLALWLFS